MQEREGFAGRGPADEAGSGPENRARPAGKPGADAAEGEGVLTLVCFKCGTEYYFAEGEPPADLTCEKCGNTVFRSFFSTSNDEAADDFEETTGRDLDPDDAEGDVLPGDVLDLNRD